VSIETRLKQAEEEVLRMGPDPEPVYTAEEWLARWEAWGRIGYFKAEPDFVQAVAEMRFAVERQLRDGPDYPPAQFPPHMNPDVGLAHQWLFCMAERIQLGIRPLTLADLSELMQWCRSTRPRLPQHPEFLDWGTLDGMPVKVVAWDFEDGPKSADGQAAGVIIRRLRAVLEGRGADPRESIAEFYDGFHSCHLSPAQREAQRGKYGKPTGAYFEVCPDRWPREV
jgi:hypothetical protein